MKCPPEIADILLDMLYTGAIAARMAGWSKDAEKAAIEADHIHNLPHLIQKYSLKRLRYYWEVERPSYVSRMGCQPIQFEGLWERLEPLVQHQLSTIEGGEGGHNRTPAIIEERD